MKLKLVVALQQFKKLFRKNILIFLVLLLLLVLGSSVIVNFTPLAQKATAQDVTAQVFPDTSNSQRDITTVFEIQIDARKLYYTYFILETVNSSFERKNSREVVTLKLPAGKYYYQVSSAASFSFEVTSEGKIDYNPELYTFLRGRGTTELIVDGLEVTIDARYLTGSGIIVDVNAPEVPFVIFEKLRLLPLAKTYLEQGSGLVASFTYGLDVNGNFSYDQAYDLNQGGFLGGQGTSTLIFYGYPVVIDTRASKAPVLLLAEIANSNISPSKKVLIANLLPVNGIALNIDSGVVTKSSFGVNIDGKLIVDSDSASSFTVSEFKGIPLLIGTESLK